MEGIGRLVDEFSSFARMPQPQFKSIDLTEICGQMISFEKTRFPQIEYKLNVPDKNFDFYGDRQQISQVLSNILKNAAESIVTRFSNNDEKENGLISMDMEELEESVRIHVSDNGIGLPSQLLDRITEPYVTTRQNGTGLGLAIAKKIMEDHSGDLLLVNNDNVGARVTIIFNKIKYET